MLKIAIVGCGKIADAHAAIIHNMDGCEIVGVCDREPLMTQQLAERFPVKRQFTDVAEMLYEARPHVVHITTPPESHYEIANLILMHGSHVYVEKPFTVSSREAESLLNLAEEEGLKITVGHNNQFTHVARRMRELVRSGYLGGSPVHMESYYCYDLGDPSYAAALLGDKQHWVRRLPGKLLQNVISHGIARLSEYLSGESIDVIARGFVSPMLESIEEHEIVDELRVIISEKNRMTAYFTFSTQMKPGKQEFRIYGPQNGLVLDQNHETLIRLRGKSFPSYAEKFIPPFLFIKDQFKNVLTNAGLFLRRDFHMDSGMKYLVESFYRSIREDSPLPISYKEILLTAKIMDAIFEQVGTNCSLAAAEGSRTHHSPHRTGECFRP